MSLDIYSYRELDEELDACKAYLVGHLADDRPLTDALGRAALLWECLRHVSYDELRSVPLSPRAGFFVRTEGFPDIPFPSMPETKREELCSYMEERPLAVNIESTQRLAMLGFTGYLANAEKEKISAVRRGTRMNTDASGNEVERVTDIVFTIRGHHGIDLCKKQIDQLLDEHPEWFLPVLPEMVLQKLKDPQRRLADLAAARLVHLLGHIKTARRWTEANRPHRKCVDPQREDFLPFVGEKVSVRGTREKRLHTGPFMPKRRQWKATLKRAETFNESLQKKVLSWAPR